jgi:hypothetical protein
MDAEGVKAEIVRLLGLVRVDDLLRRIAYGGFDSYEDYFKYGEAFLPVEIPKKTDDPLSGKRLPGRSGNEEEVK